MHNHRSFSHIESRFEAEVTSLLWALDSLCHLRQQPVIFKVSSKQVAEAVKISRNSPAYRVVLEDINNQLNLFPSWHVMFNANSCILAAESINLTLQEEDRLGYVTFWYLSDYVIIGYYGHLLFASYTSNC